MEELNQIINLECAKVSLGYGGILQLDLGELVEYKHPDMKCIFHGIWRVFSEYGLWRITKLGVIVAGSYDEEMKMETAFKLFDGKMLKQVEISETSSDA